VARCTLQGGRERAVRPATSAARATAGVAPQDHRRTPARDVLKGSRMTDVILILVTVAFFVAAVLYVHACDRT
jgi:hypothetical protein